MKEDPKQVLALMLCLLGANTLITAFTVGYMLSLQRQVDQIYYHGTQQH